MRGILIAGDLRPVLRATTMLSVIRNDGRLVLSMYWVIGGSAECGAFDYLFIFRWIAGAAMRPWFLRL